MYVSAAAPPILIGSRIGPAGFRPGRRGDCRPRSAGPYILAVVHVRETLDFQPNPGDRAHDAVGILAQAVEGFRRRVGQRRVEHPEELVEALGDAFPKRLTAAVATDLP